MKTEQQLSIWFHGSMQWTMFSPLHASLEKMGITISKDIDTADVVISREWQLKSLVKLRWKYGKKRFMGWYDEPNSLNACNKKSFGGIFIPKVELMLPENGEIFQSITTIFGWACKRGPDAIGINIKSYPEKIVSLLRRKGVVTANSKRLKPDGNDLQGIRIHIAETAHELGAGDVFGPGWPEHVRKNNSRDDVDLDWHDAKLSICDEYGFTLSMENTFIPYYVTEKIWDAIQCDTVPIYYGSEWIYDEFPKGSFVDVRDFSSAQELIKFCGLMTTEEKERRKKLCLDVYSRLINEGRFEISDQELCLRTAKRLQVMCGK